MKNKLTDSMKKQLDRHTKYAHQKIGKIDGVAELYTNGYLGMTIKKDHKGELFFHYNPITKKKQRYISNKLSEFFMLIKSVNIIEDTKTKKVIKNLIADSFNNQIDANNNLGDNIKGNMKKIIKNKLR